LLKKPRISGETLSKFELIRSQFHQHFTLVFFVQKSFWQLFSCHILAKKALSYKKCVHKMLMKLTPRVNFTFYSQLSSVQFPKVQKYSPAISLFALLGSACIKAVLKILMKSTPLVKSSVDLSS